MIRNLLNTLKNKKKKAKGFTLIELIIVIAIIAILAAIAIPKFMEIRENGNKKSDLSTAKNIQTTVASLIADDKLDIAAGGTGFVVSTAENAGSTAPGDLVRNNLQDEPEVKSNAAKIAAGSNLTYFVSVSANGNIEVYVGNSAATSARIYPDATIANW